MVTATPGVLLSCDGAMRQFVLHLDEQQIKHEGKDSFVISSELDDSHLLVQANAVEFIQRKVEELQASNSFSRAVELDAARLGAEEKVSATKKRRG